MNTIITNTSKSETSIYLELTCGKTSAVVGFSKYGVNVCCQNAAHRAWRKLGKRFTNVEVALANYKSPEMKAIIEAAADYAKTASTDLFSNRDTKELSAAPAL